MSPWKDWISETVIAKLQKKVALAGPAMNRRYDMKCLLFLESFIIQSIEKEILYYNSINFRRIVFRKNQHDPKNLQKVKDLEMVINRFPHRHMDRP